jgi:CRP-like cAMP-binding protein
VISLCDSAMCLLDQKSFKNSLGKIQRKRDQQKIEFIEKNVISGHSKEFGSLAHTIGINFNKRQIKKGEKLFSQGELPEKIFIVLSGQIRLWADQCTDEAAPLKKKKSTNTFDCHPMMITHKDKRNITELAIVGVGELIGEESLFSGNLRRYNASADVETSVYEINNERFLVVCENNPPVKQLMMQLAEKKATVVNILESRAVKAGKKFNMIADTIIKKQITTDTKDNASEREFRLAQVKFIAQNQLFTNMVSRTKVLAVSQSEISKKISARNNSVSELGDIDRIIISMKTENDASRKAIQKAIFSRTHRRNYTDHQKLLLKALGKTADNSTTTRKHSPENSNIMNIVSTFRPFKIDREQNYLNLKRTCSLVFKKSMIEQFPSMHSRQISDKRFKAAASRMHYRTSSQGDKAALPAPLITQIQSERNLADSGPMHATQRLHLMSMVDLRKSSANIS